MRQTTGTRESNAYDCKPCKFAIKVYEFVCKNGAQVAEIQLRNLSKRWGNFVGVHDFDLTISDQEFLALLGLSGCGKTMRMIAGLEDASSGDIIIDRKHVNDLDPKDRDVPMVFQSYALYPNLDVYENIRFPLKVRKSDPAQRAAPPRWWS